MDKAFKNKNIDVVVIGGGAAGSAAALQLGRIRRSVVVIDAGEPRNAPAAHMHGYLGHGGMPPAEFLATAHHELDRYGVAVVHDRVASLAANDASHGRFEVVTASGQTYHARRVLLATGLTDVLPELPGLAQHWGDKVIHCPWCHGWEVRDQRIAVIDTSGVGGHQAILFAQLSSRVTLVRNLQADVSLDESDRLDLLGITTELRPATGIEVTGDRVDLHLADGATLEVDVVVVGARFSAATSMVEGLLDVEEHVSGMGTSVVVDAMGMTSCDGIFAAGNVANPMQQVLHAAADGSRVAGAITMHLIEDDIKAARASAAESAEWNERYGEHESHMWSGRPNGSLEVELTGQAPGRALDVGCGEGADAIWLAKQGWSVTATDISGVAIERARLAADQTGTAVDFETSDALVQPPLSEAYDLVVMCYPALKHPGGMAAMQSIAAAVAPNGEFLVIGHDINHETASDHGFDPSDYLSIDDIVETIADTFTIEFDEVRERPNPPAGAHHIGDRVLRARRRPAGK